MVILEWVVEELKLFNNDLKKLMGISYEKGKKNCYWLCKEIYKKRGIELPEYDEPDEMSLISQLISDNVSLGEEIKEPEPFCFVLFSMRYPYVTHMGVVLEDCKSFVHLMRKRNVAIEKLDKDFWKKRIKGYYRWIGK